ncbi:Kdo hydroxylase family protein [Sphingobium phenoxybenzoativorans]|uniref:Kdo hydroxylase family protein n=1 Tax=Sphingobium phenoxybenzoativorans TaxID=1592790 RepID=A0A975K3T8_9SPHN|nr:Kdo hydroxylase family protein [Sphingobium phenoxybenzoativorans]QUT04349.1 Kdo hydroxylase family protein [Sphingobium phenoxybenzoativorans]
MPKLVINPRIPNPIRIIDYRHYCRAPEEKSEELARFYENGDLIVLKNYTFTAGRDTFNKVVLPNKRGKTKLFLHIDEKRHGEPPREKEWNSLKEQIENADVSIDEFKSAVGKANGDLMDLCESLFPFYHYKRRYCIYNLCEMLAHNLHFDSPEHAGDFTQLRVFVNLDNFPRIWRIGEKLEQVVDDCYDTGRLKDSIGKHPREFTRQTTRSAFGDRYESGAHRYSMHSIAFHPGEVWFLNPNMLAHEVVYGRRILDGAFLFDASYLRNPQRFYPRIVETLHKEHLGAAAYTWRKGTEKVRSHLRAILPTRIAPKR